MQYTSYLKWSVISGLVLIPFISFIVAGGSLVPSMFFPYITGKNFVFRLLIELLLILYVALALKDPKYRPKGSYILWTVCAFVGWMAVATLLSVDPVKSFWSNFERMDGYITVLHLFALFFIAGAVLTAEKWWDKFFRVSIVVGAIQGVYALLQVLHLFGLAPSSQSGPRADTSFGNATYLAVFMLYTIFLTILMLVRDRKSPTAVTLYGIALLLEFPALYFTETRGAMLGVLGGIIVAALYVALFNRGQEWRTVRRVSWGTLGVIAILVALFFAFKDTSFVRQSPGLGRLASISLQDPTTQSRLLYIWPMAVKGALEKPVHGWGQENFNFIFNSHYNPAMYAQEQWFDRAHNEFLDWFVAGGVPALVLYVALFGFAIWAIMRSQLSVPEQAVLLGLLAAYGFNNLFVFDNLMSIVFFFLLLAYLHGLSWKALPRWMFWLKPAHDHTVAIVAPIVAVCIVAGGWYFNASGMARAETILGALGSIDETHTAEQKLSVFESLLPGGQLGRQETVEQLLQFANVAAASSSVSPETRQNIYTYASKEGEDLLLERKNDARLELFVGTFFSQYNQYTTALSHLDRAAALSPNKQQILFQQGQTYIQKGDVNTGLAIFKKAFELAPDDDEARIFYASALYYADKSSDADALLVDKFGTTIVDNDQLVRIYSQTNHEDRVIAIWQKRVAANPNDVDMHLQLASAYFAAGQTSNTIAELETVAKLKPDAAAQVQSLITQIKSGKLLPTVKK